MIATSQQAVRSIGDCIENLYELRERRRELTKELDDIKRIYAAMEAEIITAMDAQDTEIARCAVASATIREERIAKLTEWDDFSKYARETDQLHLLQRRIANAAWRELVDSGETVPGTEPFTKRFISLRTR